MHVTLGEHDQINFLGSLVSLERVVRPDYLLADHQRAVEYEMTLAARGMNRRASVPGTSGTSFAQTIAQKALDPMTIRTSSA